MLLCFDTATPHVTVALHDGEQVVASYDSDQAMKHGEMLAPGIARVLADVGALNTDVSAIGVGVGPGPFTGLRVGLVTARTMAMVLQIPVYGVCTLDIIAAEAQDLGLSDFAVATDARRKEVYLASYDGAGRVAGPDVLKPASAATDAVVIGRGGLMYPDAFPRAQAPEHPSARVLCDVIVNERFPLVDPEPLYLRRPDAIALAASARASKRVS